MPLTSIKSAHIFKVCTYNIYRCQLLDLELPYPPPPPREILQGYIFLKAYKNATN